MEILRKYLNKQCQSKVWKNSGPKLGLNFPLHNFRCLASGELALDVTLHDLEELLKMNVIGEFDYLSAARQQVEVCPTKKNPTLHRIGINQQSNGNVFWCFSHRHTNTLPFNMLEWRGQWCVIRAEYSFQHYLHLSIKFLYHCILKFPVISSILVVYFFYEFLTNDQLLSYGEKNR